MTGVKDLYFKFVGGGGYVFDTRSFSFQRIAPGLKQIGSSFSASGFDLESAPAGAPIVIKNEVVESITDDSWVAYRGFDFGSNANLLAIEGATPGAGGRVEIRLDSAKGPLVSTVHIHYTGSWAYYRLFSGAFAKPVSGVHDLYLCFVDTNGSCVNLFNIKNFIVRRTGPALPSSRKAFDAVEGKLNVCPPVPGLDPSPYYSFSVQKTSELNTAIKQKATNWEHPFAWFTRCVDYDPNVKSGYYEEFVGSWSHTYCNFELNQNTPIVVKITRLKHGKGVRYLFG